MVTPVSNPLVHFEPPLLLWLEEMEVKILLLIARIDSFQPPLLLWAKESCAVTQAPGGVC